MTPFKINQTLQQDPITAVLHLRKASKPRRIKMLLNILDNYTDIGSRRKAILKFTSEIQAIKVVNKGFGPKLSNKELVEKVVGLLGKSRH
jgi:hypothetical protein